MTPRLVGFQHSHIRELEIVHNSSSVSRTIPGYCMWMQLLIFKKLQQQQQQQQKHKTKQNNISGINLG